MMNKNNRSIDNIADNQELVNPGFVIEGLAGLKGGKKQHWISTHLKEIEMLYDMLGPEQTRKALYMKPETLEKALQKAERTDRRSYRLADQAMNKAIIASEKYYQLRPEVDNLVQQLGRHIDDDQEFRKHLSDYFQLQAAASSMMAKIVQNQDYIMSSADRHNVSPTPEKLSHKDTITIKAGPTSSKEADRFTVSRKVEAGKQQLSGPGTRLSPRQRYEQSKQRGKRRV